MTEQPDFGKPFVLVRDTDVSGVSGTGIVADGVLFPDGHAAVHWRGQWPTTTPHPGGMESVTAVHGHGGATRVVWQTIEGPPPARYGEVWPELNGWVLAAHEDGEQIDPAQLLDYLRELRHKALAPVNEWVRRTTSAQQDGGEQR